MENNSKQVLLSIVGIAVLVIAVIGVSFAFFSYSRTGASNNVITTGEIYMEFEDTNNILLHNQFPMLDSEATAENGITGISGDVAYMNFTVRGKYNTTKTNAGIEYTIYAVPPTASATTLKDSEVSVFLKSYPASGVTNVVSSPTAVGSLTTDTTNQKVLAKGKIIAGSTQQVDSYQLAMFVNDTVRISDTDLTVDFTGAKPGSSNTTKYCASAPGTNTVDIGNNQTRTDSTGCMLYLNGNNTLSKIENGASTTGLNMLKVYSTMSYTLKVKVVGNEV